jgi:tetratricopeptide (TPR) repeat protein
LNTVYLLLALTRLPELQFARSLFMPLTARWAGFEVFQEDELLAILPSTLPERARAARLAIAQEHLYSGQFQKARDCFADLGELEGSELMMLGISYCLEGGLGRGLELHRQVASSSPEPVYATCVAEGLMWLGRYDEARGALPQSDEQFTMMIRANLAESPEECLSLCERVEALGEGQYFELAEARGLAYHQLGRFQEAGEALRLFLEARVDNSLLTLRHKRMAHARGLLAEMGHTIS